MDYFATADSIPLRHSPAIILVLLIAYLTVLVVGLVGNVFVIGVVLKLPKMKTATKYFILNLAIADVLVLIFCLTPSLISNIYVPWVMGSLMCKAVSYIQGVSVCASVYSLAAISGDRLLAIWFPLRRQVSKSLARKIIILIWVLGAGLALPWLLYFDLSIAEDLRDPTLVFCIESWPPGINGNIYFVVVNLGLLYLFPLSFITFCHLSIWLRVRRRQVPMDSSVSRMQLLHERAKTSVEKLVIAVVFGFTVCWLPLYVIFVRIKLIPAALGPTEEKVLDYAMPIAQWLGAANSCLNPILYAFFNRNFRCTLQRIFRGSCAFTTPRNLSNSHQDLSNNLLNEGAENRTNIVRLNTSSRRSQPKNGQLKNFRCTVADPSESNWTKLRQKNCKLHAIKRSETYEAAMESPM